MEDRAVRGMQIFPDAFEAGAKLIGGWWCETRQEKRVAVQRVKLQRWGCLGIQLLSQSFCPQPQSKVFQRDPWGLGFPP